MASLARSAHLGKAAGRHVQQSPLYLWAVTVGTNMAGFVPVIGDQVKFLLLAGVEVSGATLLRFYVLHVLFFPFVIVVFMAVFRFTAGVKSHG